MKKERVLTALRQKVSEQPLAPKMGLSLEEVSPGYALAIYLASLQFPSELISLIPYLATVIALTIYSARALKKRTHKAEEAKRVGKITDVKESP